MYFAKKYIKKQSNQNKQATFNNIHKDFFLHVLSTWIYVSQNTINHTCDNYQQHNLLFKFNKQNQTHFQTKQQTQMAKCVCDKLAAKSAMRHAMEEIQKMNTYLCGEKKRKKRTGPTRLMLIGDETHAQYFIYVILILFDMVHTYMLRNS